jgi:hypothetical protein
MLCFLFFSAHPAFEAETVTLSDTNNILNIYYFLPFAKKIQLPGCCFL